MQANGFVCCSQKACQRIYITNIGHTGNTVVTTWICKVFAKSKKKTIQM